MEKTELVIQFTHIFNLIAVNLFRLTRLRIFIPSVVLTAWFEEQPATVNSAAAVKIEVIRICFCMVFSLLFSCFL